jgi:hypothetical protein
MGYRILFSSSVTNGKVTCPDGVSWYAYGGNKTIKQTGGIGSVNYNDYVFSITGSHSYGAGACDSIATLTIGTQAKTIGLSR